MTPRVKSDNSANSDHAGTGHETVSLRRPARLEDIAQKVGVSRSEVSRVLNGRLREGRSVGLAKQEAIWRVARELNYQPHRAAQTLARGRTDTVALLVQVTPDRELSPHYHEIVGSLTHTLNEFGLQLLLAQWDGDPLPALQRLVHARSCDAILLTDMAVHDPRPAFLAQFGQSFVIRGSATEGGQIAIGMDNAAVGRLAIEHLASFGHRRILFHNIGRDLMSGEGRFTGFHESVERLGLAGTVRYEDTVYGEEGVFALTRDALTGPNPPTAIFAADELGACGALRAIQDLGLKVPDDISLLTCLNARFMRRVLPRLSVINVRQTDVATEAGKLLARVARGENVPAVQSFLQPELEDNGSVAPPAHP